MSEDSFNIYYAGEVLEGHDAADVRRELGALFKAADATLDKLFSGETRLIRRGCSRDEALRYKAAMERVGARPRIARHRDESEPGTLTVADPGADVLRPEERRQPEAPAIDIGSLSLAATGERLAPEAEAPPPPPATADLSVAPVGETLLETTAEAPVPPPDISGLSLAEGDAPAPSPPDVPAVTVPELSLAEPGSDVLEERYRHRDTPPAPDTSHLELEP